MSRFSSLYSARLCDRENCYFHDEKCNLIEIEQWPPRGSIVHFILFAWLVFQISQETIESRCVLCTSLEIIRLLGTIIQFDIERIDFDSTLSWNLLLCISIPKINWASEDLSIYQLKWFVRESFIPMDLLFFVVSMWLKSVALHCVHLYICEPPPTQNGWENLIYRKNDDKK